MVAFVLHGPSSIMEDVNVVEMTYEKPDTSWYYEDGAGNTYKWRKVYDGSYDIPGLVHKPVFIFDEEEGEEERTFFGFSYHDPATGKEIHPGYVTDQMKVPGHSSLTLHGSLYLTEGERKKLIEDPLRFTLTPSCVNGLPENLKLIGKGTIIEYATKKDHIEVSVVWNGYTMKDTA